MKNKKALKNREPAPGKTKLPHPLRKEFARVASHPSIQKGKPFLEEHPDINLGDVLDMLRKKSSASKIQKKYPQLRPFEIDLCRAYLVCLKAKDAAARGKRNTFLVDENISHMILPDLAAMFGRVSHVKAEHLHGETPDKTNDDEKHIWAFAVKRGYRAVLTRDADFKPIAEKYHRHMLKKYGGREYFPEPVPALIHVVHNGGNDNLVSMFRKNKSAIRRYIFAPDTVYKILHAGGLSNPGTVIPAARNNNRKPQP